MTRYTARRLFALMASILLALLILPAASHPEPAQAQDELDISKYMVGGNNVDRTTKTSIEMWHRGDWVELKGPITISVLVWHTDKPDTNTNTVKIESEKTVTIGVDEYSETHPGDWNATITLVSVDKSLDLKLLLLVFGATGEEIMIYLSQNRNGAEAAGKAGDAAQSGFTTTVENGRKNPADFPNLEQAAKAFGMINLLTASKNTITGQPLFPSLQSKGVQMVLTRMALGAAESKDNYGALNSLVRILVGLDMAKQKGAHAP